MCETRESTSTDQPKRTKFKLKQIPRNYTPKLRTYKLFKTRFAREEYLNINLTKNERSVLCQFRTGILPLRIETGRFIGERLEERTCKFCDAGTIENEIHFLLNCSAYSHLRDILLTTVDLQCQSNNEQKMTELINIYPRKLAKFIYNAFSLRKALMYSR